MSTITLLNYDSIEIEELEQSEKIKCRQKAVMPVRQSHATIRGSHRRPTSGRSNRTVSSCNSGMQHRRLRRASR